MHKEMIARDVRESGSPFHKDSLFAAALKAGILNSEVKRGDFDDAGMQQGWN